MTTPTFELVCEDAAAFLRGLKGQVDLILTSPPYNIGSKAPRSDGRRASGKFDRKSYGGITGYEDALPELDYQKGQIAVMRAAASALKDDGVVVYNHKPRRQDGRMIHPMEWLSKVKGLALMEEIIWDRGGTHKTTALNCSGRTRSSLYVFRKAKGRWRLRNTADLTFRSNLWRVPLTTKPALGHPAPFPLPLAQAVMDAFARPGDLVADPYSGSGTTGVAAILAGANYIGGDVSADFLKASGQQLSTALTPLKAVA